MAGPFVLIVIVAGAYLAAHWAFEWLGTRYLIVSGAEYLVLGILLGPRVSGVLQVSVLDGFAPLMVLAIGWIGASVGSTFYVPQVVRSYGAAYRVAFVEALLALAATATFLTGALAWIYQLPLADTVAPAVALGAIATVSSPAGVAMLRRRLVRRGVVVRQIEVTTAIDAFVAIIAFSLLLCIEHSAPATGPRAPTPTEWAVISVAIGCVGGSLFHLFVGNERDIDRLFISIAGAVILVSGAAAYLRVSPLLPAMLLGAMLGNTRRNRSEIRQALSRVQRPLYFVLLVFAGAAWDPGTIAWWILPALVFVVVRAVAKLGAARLAALFNGLTDSLGRRWGRALLGQGGLAIAIALNYQLFHGTMLLPDVVFTAAIVSVVLTDLSSARFVQSVVGRYTQPVLDAETPVEPSSALQAERK
ncbi:MAG TPA: cation:proton antiporter [Gemmatimonadaceae bacterium]|nr:cation:proton antiporter [Gemmatimonadaceae bacterium]